MAGARSASLDRFQKMPTATDGPIQANEHWNAAIAAQLTTIDLDDDVAAVAAAGPNANAMAEPESDSSRPSMDIFKAIFSDSSSDEDEDGDGDGDGAGPRGADLPAEAPIMPAPYDPTLVHGRGDDNAGEGGNAGGGTCLFLLRVQSPNTRRDAAAAPHIHPRIPSFPCPPPPPPPPSRSAALPPRRAGSLCAGRSPCTHPYTCLRGIFLQRTIATMVPSGHQTVHLQAPGHRTIRRRPAPLQRR